jgi:hypothetical protein
VLLILHNPYDKASRDFVAANPDLPVLDWTHDISRQEWLAAGGILTVSAFPSIVYERPELVVEDTDAQGAKHRRRVARGLEVVRLPPTAADAARRQADHEALAAVTWVEVVADQLPDALAEEAAKAEPIVAEAEKVHAPRAQQARDRLDKANP